MREHGADLQFDDSFLITNQAHAIDLHAELHFVYAADHPVLGQFGAKVHSFDESDPRLEVWFHRIVAGELLADIVKMAGFVRYSPELALTLEDVLADKREVDKPAIGQNVRASGHIAARHAVGMGIFVESEIDSDL